MMMLAIAGTVGLLTTERFAKEENAKYEQVRAARAALQSKLARATDEEREIRGRLRDYQALRERGVVGEEHRLDWVEIIKAIRSERQLYDVKYSIEPRKPIDYPSLKPTSEVELMASRMRIEAALLHEGDLFNLLSDLERRMAPLVVLRSCEIERADVGQAMQAGPRLRGVCAIDLVTIRDSSEPKP